MIIKKTTPLHMAGNGKRVFLTLWSRDFEHHGKTGTYFMVTRGEKVIPHEEKGPDAVVIVATFDYKGEMLLVMTNEFRIPLGTRELGFPAGLIEKSDYDHTNSHREAAMRAAVREFKEETGLDLEVTETSPPNLYSSAGLTNESIMYVFGRATGEPSKKNLEHDEDIDTLFLTRQEAEKLLQSDLAHSKTAWPFLRAFTKNAL
jgi:ADP-ribose pyrophosphatase